MKRPEAGKGRTHSRAYPRREEIREPETVCDNKIERHINTALHEFLRKSPVAEIIEDLRSAVLKKRGKGGAAFFSVVQGLLTRSFIKKRNAKRKKVPSNKEKKIDNFNTGCYKLRLCFKPQKKYG
ncbi:MAG TPA: hypothetical protein VEI57_18675 [Nitrospirota bacterium]|nr:hypothetical protein [Nitrospirota bacterium]